MVVQMHSVQMLLHVPVVSNPKVANDTVLCELVADGWDTQPLFPSIKLLQKSYALD